ncbi:hypothetical protein [Bacillus bombysepticus]|uniref:hypothetical protein n=1 Tax=Bacillus bombysepticus TaxID=658666 RepID=UPI00301AF789
MSRIDNHSDEDLQDELESRGYHVSQNDGGGLGCSLLIGAVIIIALIFYGASYIHYFIALSHFYHWTVYTIFFAGLIISVLGKGQQPFFNFLLYLSLLPIATNIYTFIIESTEGISYADFIENAKTGSLKHAIIYLIYIVIVPFISAKLINYLIRITLGGDNSKNDSTNLLG